MIMDEQIHVLLKFIVIENNIYIVTIINYRLSLYSKLSYNTHITPIFMLYIGHAQDNFLTQNMCMTSNQLHSLMLMWLLM